MATEHTFADSAGTEVPPIVIETAAEEIKPAKEKDKPEKIEKRAKAEDDDDSPSRGSSSAGLSKTMKDLREDEEKTLKDIIQGFGDSTSYKCRITRKWPTTTKDKKTGKVFQTGGFLDWIEGTPIDEAWVQERYGGGKYELYFRKRGAKGGWDYGGQVTIDIAGEPDLKALPGNEPDPAAASAAAHRGGGDDHATNAALTMMQAELARANDRADRASTTQGGGPLVEILREQLAAANAATAALREEMRSLMNKPPVQTTDDKLKDRLFEKLVDGDSARLTAVRTQFESEIRQIKESFREDEKRMVDRFERDRQDMRNAHERELALVRSAHESALASAKSSYDIQLSAAKSSFDTQTKIMESENRKIDKDNTELRIEVKELRAKKDKGLPEMAKEIEAAKDLLGLGESEDKGIGEKIGDLVTNPDAIAALGKLIRGDGPPAAIPVAAPAAAVQERKVVKNKQGQRFIVEPDGSLTGPLREKPKAVAEGQAPAPPPIDPETMQKMVAMLENAYSNGTSPELVAQSARPHLTDQILTLIRDVGGVDQFLSKVAKLPGSSPLLSTQAGRNWVRKVGKGLVGDDE